MNSLIRRAILTGRKGAICGQPITELATKADVKQDETKTTTHFGFETVETEKKQEKGTILY